jgi:hypothetical protein
VNEKLKLAEKLLSEALNEMPESGARMLLVSAISSLRCCLHVLGMRDKEEPNKANP